MRKIQSDVQHTVITEEEGQKRRAAVWQETNAKLVDEHKKVVDTMAGQLESLFSGSITQNIINLLKKFLFKMLAEWLTHFSALQNGFGGLFSKLFGGGSEEAAASAWDRCSASADLRAADLSPVPAAA
jgi:hypothetical protein